MDEEFRDKLTQVFLDSIAETQQRSGREVQEADEPRTRFRSQIL